MKVFYESPYEYLFHLCTPASLVYIHSTNTLAAYRETHPSVTYRATTRRIYGYNGMDFKFILDGKKLVADFGAYEFDHHIREIGAGDDYDEGTSVSLNEAEYRINTKVIPNFDQYVVGLIINAELTTASSYVRLMKKPEAIDVYLSYGESGVPLYTHEEGSEKFSPLTAKQKELLTTLGVMMKAGKPKQDILQYVLTHHPLVDAFGNVTAKELDRSRLYPAIEKMINQALAETPIKQINPAKNKAMLASILDVLGIEKDQVTTVVEYAESVGFFHPSIPPFEYAVLIKELSRDGAEYIDELIKEAVRRNRGLRQRIDSGKDEYLPRNHAHCVLRQ